MKIFIVVPAYNEEKRIGNVLKELKNQRLPVIVVDDGSKDNTFKEASKSKYLILQHRVNLGKGAAMKTGAMAAFKLGANAVIFMDSDGQHSPADLDEFTRALKKGYEAVFGKRKPGKNIPQVRFLGNKLASVLIRFIYGITIRDVLCGFRAVTKKTFRIMDIKSVGYEIETEMAIKTALKKINYCEVPVRMIYLDNVKGLTLIGGIGILSEIIKWKII